MKQKKHRTLHQEKEEIVRAVEEDLIQTWQEGRLAAPTSPFAAAGALAMHSLVFLKGTQTFPNPPPLPSQAEFSRMLIYIVNQYHLSPAFPYSNEQLKQDVTTKLQEIQRRLE